jgi:hypothetical protein
VQVDREVDVFVQQVVEVIAHFIADCLPGGRAQRHIATEQQVVFARHLAKCTAQCVVGFSAEPAQGHVVVDDWPGRGGNLGVGEGSLHLFDPVRFNDRVGIDSTDDIALCAIQPEVAGRDETLKFVLQEVNERRIRVCHLQSVHDSSGVVGGHVVHDDDLARGNRLVQRGQDATLDRVFLVIGGNHNRNAGKR